MEKAREEFKLRLQETIAARTQKWEQFKSQQAERLEAARADLTEKLVTAKAEYAEKKEAARTEAEQVSLRGRTARKLVEVAYHLPVLGHLSQNGELQALRNEREKEWKCPEGYVLTKIETERFPMEMLRLEESFAQRREQHVILQLHGGGYYNRFHNTYRDAAVTYIGISGGFDVLSIDYRVAPEDPYPAALEDAVEAYRWLLEQDYLPEHIILAGDSAGGGLSLALALYLKDHRMPMPGGIVTMSAWTDLTKSGASYQVNFDKDPIFGGSRDTLVYKEGYYGEHDPMDPYISPVNGNYQGFPPMLMQVGEREMLLDDTLEVAAKAKAAGVQVKSHVYPGMFHIFQMGFHLYPEAEEAWREVGKFLRIL
ncbi:MAG: alpha/beta hydrolase fold domain-containing protein [Lachnospiraceae bacterium]|nr:alpha/beta hydrolase fold domain-containing protein [Lachnospiraceae bacterium]